MEFRLKSSKPSEQNWNHQKSADFGKILYFPPFGIFISNHIRKKRRKKPANNNNIRERNSSRYDEGFLKVWDVHTMEEIREHQSKDDTSMILDLVQWSDDQFMICTLKGNVLRYTIRPGKDKKEFTFKSQLLGFSSSRWDRKRILRMNDGEHVIAFGTYSSNRGRRRESRFRFECIKVQDNYGEEIPLSENYYRCDSSKKLNFYNLNLLSSSKMKNEIFYIGTNDPKKGYPIECFDILRKKHTFSLSGHNVEADQLRSFYHEEKEEEMVVLLGKERRLVYTYRTYKAKKKSEEEEEEEEEEEDTNKLDVIHRKVEIKCIFYNSEFENHQRVGGIQTFSLVGLQNRVFMMCVDEEGYISLFDLSSHHQSHNLTDSLRGKKTYQVKFIRKRTPSSSSTGEKNIKKKRKKKRKKKSQSKINICDFSNNGEEDEEDEEEDGSQSDPMMKYRLNVLDSLMIRSSIKKSVNHLSVVCTIGPNIDWFNVSAFDRYFFSRRNLNIRKYRNKVIRNYILEGQKKKKKKNKKDDDDDDDDNRNQNIRSFFHEPRSKKDILELICKELQNRAVKEYIREELSCSSEQYEHDKQRSIPDSTIQHFTDIFMEYLEENSKKIKKNKKNKKGKGILSPSLYCPNDNHHQIHRFEDPNEKPVENGIDWDFRKYFIPLVTIVDKNSQEEEDEGEQEEQEEEEIEFRKHTELMYLGETRLVSKGGKLSKQQVLVPCGYGIEMRRVEKKKKKKKKKMTTNEQQQQQQQPNKTKRKGRKYFYTPCYIGSHDENGMRSGKGKEYGLLNFIQSNSNKKKGNTRKNQMRKKFDGKYARGKRNGRGIEIAYIHENNTPTFRFWGTYKDGKRHGPGEEVSIISEKEDENYMIIRTGVWKDGRPTEEMEERSCKTKFFEVNKEISDQMMDVSCWKGQGANGFVSKIHSKYFKDEELRRKTNDGNVAVKILWRANSGFEYSCTERMAQLKKCETTVECCSQLNSKHVLKIYGALVGNLEIGYIMECGECSIQELIGKENGFGTGSAFSRLKEKLRILFQTSSGMNHLRIKKFIHRDLKWENVLYMKGGTIKVCDFDTCERDESFFEITGEIPTAGSSYCPGTDVYMSPESLSKQKYSYEHDVYSFGIMMFSIFVGDPMPYKHSKKCRECNKPFGPRYFMKDCVVNHRFRPDIQSAVFSTNGEIVFPELYENLMILCWSENAKKRPMFNHILNSLKKMVKWTEVPRVRINLRFDRASLGTNLNIFEETVVIPRPGLDSLKGYICYKLGVSPYKIQVQIHRGDNDKLIGDRKQLIAFFKEKRVKEEEKIKMRSGRRNNDRKRVYSYVINVRNAEEVRNGDTNRKKKAKIRRNGRKNDGSPLTPTTENNEESPMIENLKMENERLRSEMGKKDMIIEKMRLEIQYLKSRLEGEENKEKKKNEEMKNED